jgi:hypothetical protein
MGPASCDKTSAGNYHYSLSSPEGAQFSKSDLIQSYTTYFVTFEQYSETTDLKNMRITASKMVSGTLIVFTWSTYQQLHIHIMEF